MKFTQVYNYPGDKKDADKKKEEDMKKFCEAEEQKSKLNVQSAIGDRRNQISGAAGNAFKRAQGMISGSPKIQQFIIGGATGWATGFVSSKVGKTAAIIGGGSILLMVGANQAGLVTINWNKFGKKMEQTGSKLEAKVPALKGNIGKYARGNTYFVAGFVGGFLLGIAS